MNNRPVLLPKDIPFRDAYYVLHQSRTEGASNFNAIQVSEVLAYLQVLGIASAPLRVKYLGLVQKMDRIYRDYCQEQSKT